MLQFADTAAAMGNASLKLRNLPRLLPVRMKKRVAKAIQKFAFNHQIRTRCLNSVPF